MEEKKDKTANVMSRGGIDQLNKGPKEALTQEGAGVPRGGIDQLNKGGIDQLNKGGIDQLDKGGAQ